MCVCFLFVYVCVWYVSHSFLLLTILISHMHSAEYRVQAYIYNYSIHWLKSNDFNETVPTSFFKISLWDIMALSGINFTHMNHWCNQNGKWLNLYKQNVIKIYSVRHQRNANIPILFERCHAMHEFTLFGFVMFNSVNSMWN